MRNRIVGKFVLLVMLGLLPVVQAGTRVNARRTLSGIVYFTNNTPRDMDSFPVELFSRDRKRRLVAAQLKGSQFVLTDLKPGKYILKLTWPNRCVLWYRVDLTKDSITNARVIMDAACAHANGTIQDLPENQE